MRFNDIQKRDVINLLTWSYYTPKSLDILKFKKSKFNIDLPLTYFFLNLGEFFSALNTCILEILEKEDVFKFIQLNNKQKLVRTNSNKNIDLKTHFYELKGYEEIEDSASFHLQFVISP